jgi:hypothetical protein
MAKPRTDHIGRQYGRLTVIAGAPDIRTPGGFVVRRALCRCSCGTEKVFFLNDLQQRHPRCSCGCLRKETQRKHGKYKDRVYSIWRGMVSRCKPNAKCSKDYYQRGITVDPQWVGPGGFKRFYSDMGDAPPGATLDRIDNDRNYEKANCRWVTTHIEQMNNRRVSMSVSVPLATVCRAMGISYGTVTARMYRHKISLQEAFDYFLSLYYAPNR